MRLDKWLKVSRLIKRRTVAKMACDQGRVLINERISKSGAEVEKDDIVHIELGSRALSVKVLEVPAKTPQAHQASALYEIIEELRRPPEILEWLPSDENW